MRTCNKPSCETEATMAIRTTAPGALQTQIFWDIRNDALYSL